MSTPVKDRVLKYREKQTAIRESNRKANEPHRDLLQAAELFYLRDVQKKALVRFLCSRIERLVYDHPELAKRFYQVVEQVNQSLRTVRLAKAVCNQ